MEKHARVALGDAKCLHCITRADGLDSLQEQDFSLHLGQRFDRLSYMSQEISTNNDSFRRDLVPNLPLFQPGCLGFEPRRIGRTFVVVLVYHLTGDDEGA